MSIEPENLVLEMLRRLDGKVDRLAEDVADLKTRMTAVEEGLAGVNRRRVPAPVGRRPDEEARRLDLAR
ncbi:MAG: hypothetical protein VXX53_09315 [Pseudomonadota bacterium]|nr:hypothetical protein [Pseudomonadota bacterium]